MKDIMHDNFERNAWYQAEKFSSAWIWTCPKDHKRQNNIQFLIVAQTYFGVRQKCLRGLAGQSIHQKSGEGNREDKISTCDLYGENLVKATLPGPGLTYRHDEINNQMHTIIKQSSMVSQLEIEDYLIRK